MPIKSRARKSSKRNRVIKKSLTFTPAAWAIVKRRARIAGRQQGMEPNHSTCVSSLILVADEALKNGKISLH